MSAKQKRWLEFALLFLALPAGLAMERRWTPWPAPVIPALWLMAGVCLAWLMLDRQFDRGSLFRTAGLGKAVRSRLPLFFAMAAGMTVLVLVLNPDLLLGFVRKSPTMWLLVMILYPVLSVVPQAIVYRAFVFHRYRTLASRPWQMILLSAAAFSLAHLVFWNWVALGLTFAGGLLFGYTYHKTKAMLPSAVEHALYGDFVFTIGLGGYLYVGTTEFLKRAVGG